MNTLDLSIPDTTIIAAIIVLLVALYHSQSTKAIIGKIAVRRNANTKLIKDYDKFEDNSVYLSRFYLWRKVVNLFITIGILMFVYHAFYVFSPMLSPKNVLPAGEISISEKQYLIKLLNSEGVIDQVRDVELSRTLYFVSSDLKIKKIDLSEDSSKLLILSGTDSQKVYSLENMPQIFGVLSLFMLLGALAVSKVIKNENNI